MLAEASVEFSHTGASEVHLTGYETTRYEFDTDDEYSAEESSDAEEDDEDAPAGVPLVKGQPSKARSTHH